MDCTLPSVKHDSPLLIPPKPSLNNTFGAYFLCTCLGAMIYGLTTHQTYRYFRMYPSDKLYLKLLVTFLVILDTVHTATSAHACYYYLIRNYLKSCQLQEGVWSLRLGVIEGGVVVVITHCFYGRRLYLLGGDNIVPVIFIAVFLLAEIGFTIAATTEVFIHAFFAQFIPFMWIIWGMFVAAVSVDILSAAILTHYLRMNRTGFKKTDSMIDVLMVYAINTGLSTSLLSVSGLICSIVSRDNLLWAAIATLATKMYVNSLLAVLNSRRSIMEKGLYGTDSGTFGMKVITPRNATSHAVDIVEERDRMPQHLPAKPIAVRITRETFTDSPSDMNLPEDGDV